MTTQQIIFGLAVFLLAGTVKGLVGLGLPIRRARADAHPAPAFARPRDAVGATDRRRLLCTNSLALAGSLVNLGLPDGPHAVLSAVGTAPSLAGMWIGPRIRVWPSIEQFRLAVFGALALSGLYTVLRQLL